MKIDHEPHIMRAHLQEWCGGTEPPTIVTVNRDDQELYVDIFASGSNLHVGEILDPVQTEQFLIPADLQVGPAKIGTYAVRALSAGSSQNK